ncbi:MAG TPA: aminotransferase class I/II-fold pyridoxal phosphate-dependent enzyme, partial [Candidatus Glassbacteria bacterium]|nr:aminotransferase class I/II-fold pyridoxal phosphate-dependent enzyme [Candidatus Glassbacteria bacterium]
MKNIVLQGPVGPLVRIEGREYLFFGGTDYLGLAARPEVREGAHRAVDGFGISSAGSRSSSGTTELHLALERAISSFAGSPDAVLMGSGYFAMNGLLSGVLKEGDLVLLQRDGHASIMEA